MERERKERLAVGAALGLGGHDRHLGVGVGGLGLGRGGHHGLGLGGREDRSRLDDLAELGHDLLAELVAEGLAGLDDRDRLGGGLGRELQRRGLLGRGLQEVGTLVDHVLEVEQGRQRQVLAHAVVDVADGLLDEGLADVLDTSRGVVLGADVQIAIALVEVEHFARRCEDRVAQGLVEDPAVERAGVGRGHLEAGLH